MPIQHDSTKERAQGDILVRRPTDTSYTRCEILLDQPNHRLSCYPSASLNMDPTQPFIEFCTEDISLVEAAPRQKQQFCFGIHYFSKITYFSAKSWKEMEDWIHLIRESSRIKVNPAELNPSRKSYNGAYTTEIIGGSVVVSENTNNVNKTKESTTPKQLHRKDSGRNSSTASQSSTDSDKQIGSVVHPDAVRTGYCIKRGRVKKSWKRRFLLLTTTHLSYFKHELERKPLRRIELSSIKDVKVSESEVQRDNLIDVVTPNRTFLMQFDTPDEMVFWIEEIRKEAGLTVMTYL